MRALRWIFFMLCALVAFAVGLFIFAPWQTIGAYVMDVARTTASANGVYVHYDGYSATGTFVPTFSFRAMEVETPMAMLSLTNVRVTARPLSSLLSMSAVCDVSFASGTVTVISGKEMSIASGGARLSLSRATAAASDVRMTGDVQMTGSLTFDMTSRRIVNSTISFTLPTEWDAMLQNPLLSRFIERDERGGWRIRYEAKD